MDKVEVMVSLFVLIIFTLLGAFVSSNVTVKNTLNVYHQQACTKKCASVHSKILFSDDDYCTCTNKITYKRMMSELYQ